MTTFNWRAIEPNTLRAYAVAVKDFETVTGIRVDLADAVSISLWQKSMQARGLAVNTIRARLSAVSVVSGVKVELPKRQKLEVAMSLDQVRSFFAVIKNKEDRTLLVSLLLTGTQLRTFGAHFVGSKKFTSQEITRKVKRYAELAGLASAEMNMRTLVRSGRSLLRDHQAADLVNMLTPAPTKTKRVSWRPLHGSLAPIFEL
jgi:hypothetical protein